MKNSKTLYIASPRETPFGELSNNYRLPFSMGSDPKKWDNVTSYVYGSLLDKKYSIFLRKSSKRSKAGETLYKSFIKYRTMEDRHQISQSLRKASLAKFNAEPGLVELLISTGNSHLVYNSPDPFLGVGPDGRGHNQVGKELMQLRHQFCMNQLETEALAKEEERKQKIYEAYKAYKIIDDIARHGDWTILKSSINVPLEELKLPDSDIRYAEKEVVLEMYDRGQLREVALEIAQPGSLALSVLKREMRSLKFRMVDMKNHTIFDMYMNYRLGKDYPELPFSDYETAKAQHLSTLSFAEKIDMTMRVVKLFELGQLSASLSDKIDTALSRISIPSDTEIAEIEAMSLPSNKVEDPKKDCSLFKTISDTSHIVIEQFSTGEDMGPFQLLSPIEFTGLFPVDGLLFPSVSHYVASAQFSRLFRMEGLKYETTDIVAKSVKEAVLKGTDYKSLGDISLPKQGMKYGHSILLRNPGKEFSEKSNGFITIQEVWARFVEQAKFQYEYLFEYYLRRALAKKFTDLHMRSILLTTGDKSIVYLDPEDPMIGTVKTTDGKFGNNLTGKILMAIRSAIKNNDSFINLSGISDEKIYSLISGNQFIYDWVEKQVVSMTRAVRTMKNHIAVKTDGMYDNIEITAEFVESVCDTVYAPCRNIVTLAKKVTSEPTIQFYEHVARQPGFSRNTKSLVDCLWKRVIVKLYAVVKLLSEESDEVTVLNVRQYIAESERSLSQRSNCPVIDANMSNSKNCILNALKNLLARIAIFNEPYDVEAPINAIDLETAVALVLNTVRKPYDEFAEYNNVEEVVPGVVKEGAEEGAEVEFVYGEYNLSDDEEVIPSGDVAISYALGLGKECNSDVTDAIYEIEKSSMYKKTLSNRINFFAYSM